MTESCWTEGTFRQSLLWDQWELYSYWTKVSIGFNNLRAETGQLTFKLYTKEEKHKKLSQLIDNLNKKYGNNSVRIGLLKDYNKAQDCAAFGYIPESTS